MVIADDLFDPGERDQDHERLTVALDRQAILAFAQHRALASGLSTAKLVHVTAVGELAARYADAFYSTAGDWLESRYHRRVCEVAGFLHEVMEQGCDFEAVVEAADEAVARVVASLTPDRRVSRPRRLMLLTNQLGLSAVDAQIVKLADLRHESKLLADLRNENKLLPESECACCVHDWTLEAATILGSLTRLKNTPLAGRIAALRHELTDLESAIRRRS